jgi:hypothetical protein
MMHTDFQDFQRAFGRHLRDPHHVPRPPGVPARRMAAYNELLFNNLCSFLDACFPVARAMLGEARWRRLSRSFYRDWPLHTPWFREIPREFVRYVLERRTRLRLARYLPDLLHYEWVELAVDTMEATVPAHDPGGDLMQGVPVLNPALMNLAYDWPVHRVGPDERPRRPQATWLIVHRDAADAVRFVESNATTARLIELLAPGTLSGRDALATIAAELRHPDPEALFRFGYDLLAQLRGQGIILGAAP